MIWKRINNIDTVQCTSEIQEQNLFTSEIICSGRLSCRKTFDCDIMFNNLEDYAEMFEKINSHGYGSFTFITQFCIPISHTIFEKVNQIKSLIN